MLERLASAIFAHPRAVVLAWTGVILVGAAIAAGLFGELANRNSVVSGSESQRTTAALERHLPGHDGSQVSAVVTVSRPVDRALGVGVLTERSQFWRLISEKTLAASHAFSALPDVTQVREAANDVRIDGDRVKGVTVFAIHLDMDPASAEKRVPALRSTLAEVADASASTGLVGGIAISQRYSTIARDDLARAEEITLPVTLAVLLLAFLSIVAAALPVLLAVATLSLTFAFLYLLGSQVGLSVFVTNTASVLALGLSIDFSLFMVTRFREELLGSRSVEQALRRTMATTGRAVILSGATIATALLSLLAVGVEMFSSMAIGATVASLIAVLTAVTLLPAILCLLGPRLDRFTVRRAARAADRARLWHRLAGVVVSHPVPTMLVSLAILGGLAVPALSLRLGAQTLSALPADDPVKQESARLAEAFGPGAGGAVQVVTRQDLGLVKAVLQQDPNVGRTWDETVGSRGWSSLQAVLRISPDSAAARRTVQRLRDELGTDARPTYVGGLTATGMDLTERIADRTPTVVLIAAVLGMLALAYGLRSVVIPVKALLSTLLSVAATVGVLLVLLPSGADGSTLEFFVPLFLFAIVFGLSMDYEVFLLSRIREAVLAGHPEPDAVRIGLIRSGRSITLAALTLATVFVAFATSSLDAFRQLGVGVAVAVILDVTLVRCLLIPASVVLLGRWNWWFPGRRPAQQRDRVVTAPGLE